AESRAEHAEAALATCREQLDETRRQLARTQTQVERLLADRPGPPEGHGDGAGGADTPAITGE
ncbi:hypothetical protein, partial [Saccharomonospora iraqiensis]|uniref:hypothetical protein n=1 Tax=Saccharomonospora iraqiensis TaxID=52698 RepID=UPI00022DFCFD